MFYYYGLSDYSASGENTCYATVTLPTLRTLGGVDSRFSCFGNGWLGGPGPSGSPWSTDFSSDFGPITFTQAMSASGNVIEGSSIVASCTARIISGTTTTLSPWSADFSTDFGPITVIPPGMLCSGTAVQGAVFLPQGLARITLVKAVGSAKQENLASATSILSVAQGYGIANFVYPFNATITFGDIHVPTSGNQALLSVNASGSSLLTAMSPVVDFMVPVWARSRTELTAVTPAIISGQEVLASATNSLYFFSGASTAYIAGSVSGVATLPNITAQGYVDLNASAKVTFGLMSAVGSLGQLNSVSSTTKITIVGAVGSGFLAGGLGGFVNIPTLRASGTVYRDGIGVAQLPALRAVGALGGEVFASGTNYLADFYGRISAAQYEAAAGLSLIGVMKSDSQIFNPQYVYASGTTTLSITSDSHASTEFTTLTARINIPELVVRNILLGREVLTNGTALATFMSATGLVVNAAPFSAVANIPSVRAVAALGSEQTLVGYSNFGRLSAEGNVLWGAMFGHPEIPALRAAATMQQVVSASALAVIPTIRAQVTTISELLAQSTITFGGIQVLAQATMFNLGKGLSSFADMRAVLTVQNDLAASGVGTINFTAGGNLGGATHSDGLVYISISSHGRAYNIDPLIESNNIIYLDAEVTRIEEL